MDIHLIGDDGPTWECISGFSGAIIDMDVYELVVYQDVSGKEPFTKWTLRLPASTRDRVFNRLNRLRSGNLGDYKSLGEGVFELRLFGGSGLRIYFGFDGRRIVVLLTGGDKSSQQRDIMKARAYWRDYHDSKRI